MGYCGINDINKNDWEIAVMLTKMMAMFVLFSSYVLYLSLLLSGSKVTLACENSLAKHWLN